MEMGMGMDRCVGHRMYAESRDYSVYCCHLHEWLSIKSHYHHHHHHRHTKKNSKQSAIVIKIETETVVQRFSSTANDILIQYTVNIFLRQAVEMGMVQMFAMEMGMGMALKLSVRFS